MSVFSLLGLRQHLGANYGGAAKVMECTVYFSFAVRRTLGPLSFSSFFPVSTNIDSAKWELFFILSVVQQNKQLR